MQLQGGQATDEMLADQGRTQHVLHCRAVLYCILHVGEACWQVGITGVWCINMTKTTFGKVCKTRHE